MANTLKFKRGLLAGLPAAAEGEPLFTTDTADLYIGTSTGTQKFQKFIASGATTQILRGDGSLFTFPLTISSPTNGQVLKYNGTAWVNDSDAGITGSGAAGQVTYWNGTNTQTGSNNLFWDATNSRLGVGTNVPSTSLHVVGQITGNSFIPTSATIPVNGMYLPNTNTIAFSTNTQQKLILDANGNLGLGVTLKAWGVGSSAFELGNGGIWKSGSRSVDWIVNGFNNGTNYIYNVSAAATFYRQFDGSHQFWNAPSGTAGNAITFTQAMTLTANGRLLLGSTSDTGELLQVNGTMKVTGASTFSSNIRAANLGIGRDADLQTNYGVISNGGTSGTFYRAFTGSTETFRIQTTSTTTNVQAFGGDLRIDTGGQTYAMLLTSAGNVGISTTAPAYRLDVSGDMRVSLAATFSSSVTAASLVVDTNTLVVDATNDRVGIGTATPLGKLSIDPLNGQTRKIVLYDGGINNNFQFYGLGIEANTMLYSVDSSTTGKHLFVGGTGTTTRATMMELNVTGLGIGGTPTQKLDVQGAVNSIQARFGNVIGRGLVIRTTTISGTNDAGVILNAPTTTDGTLVFQTSSVDRLTLSATTSTFSTSVTSTQFNLSALNTAPATSSSTGTLGEIRIDADHIYICTATNTWKRVAISTF
jgi:hypothetical protein